MAECWYKETDVVPDGHLYEDIVPAFQLPPLGKSTKEDFNPMVHLEIDADKQEDGEAVSEDAKNKDGKDADNVDLVDEDDDDAYDENPKKSTDKEPQYYVAPTEE